MRIGIVAAVVCAGLASDARAETGGTVVFQLEASNLEPELADIPVQLTEAIAERIGGEASQATVSDLALQLECSATQSNCINRMRRLVKADAVVWGKLAWNSYTRQLKVTLTVAIDHDKPESNTYVLSTTKPGDVQDELMGVAEGFLAKFDPPPPIVTPLITDEPERSGGVSGTTYLILGTGGVALASGVAFYALAYGYAQQWAEAPAGTSMPELQDLQDRRDYYWTISRVLLVGGAAFATWGIVRAVREHDEPAVGVAPTLVEGGGGIAAFGRF